MSLNHTILEWLKWCILLCILYKNFKNKEEGEKQKEKKQAGGQNNNNTDENKIYI